MSLVTSNRSVWVKIARLQLNYLNSSQWEISLSGRLIHLWCFFDSFEILLPNPSTKPLTTAEMTSVQSQRSNCEKACEKNSCFLIGCWSHLFYHAWSLVTRGYRSLQPPCRLSGAETLSKQRAAWWWKPSQTAAGAPQLSSFSCF